jgi:L-lactate dehydrogenase
MSRYEASALLDFVADLFQAEGLPRERAEIVARGFLEADLLGFHSHGLVRVPANLGWLKAGETDPTGDPQVLLSRPALANWDAHRLAGHWAMHRAVTHAVRQARITGVFTLTVRRAQHVACLAASLIPVIDARLVALMMVSSPEEAFVSPFGGSQRLFSNNPIAFTAPATAGPVLFDLSMAITAGGQVEQAARLGRLLPEASLKTAAGQLSADPADLSRGGSVQPIGGPGHGHKGHALTIMTELLSQALGGYGRARSSGSSEQNSVYLQVLDPAAFGPAADYQREADHLLAMIEASPADDVNRPVRVPGRRAWQERARQLADGVELAPDILEGMMPFAEAIGLALPASLH